MSKQIRVEHGYKCTSPTLMRFHRSNAPYRVTMGPISSGKSFASCAEVMKLAKMMPPCADGVRRSKVAFLRDTATNLRDTTMATWLKLFPEKFGENGGVTKVNWSPPMDMRVEMDLDDGTRMELIIVCRHQSCASDLENLKSLELTGVYINELTGVPKDNVMMAISRTGRYPDKKLMPINPETGKPFEPKFYMIADTNYPDDLSWIYDFAEVSHPVGWEFFKQPPAMFCLGKDAATGRMKYVPNRGQRIAQGILPAENVENLTEGWGYYKKQIAGNSHAFVNVFICANYGNLSTGQPVYPNYNDLTHYVDEDIPFDRTKTLFLGFDWGLYPSCVMVQMSDAGQVQVLEEVDGEGVKMGIEQLWDSKLSGILLNSYGWGRGTQIFAIGDPAVGTSQVDMNNCIALLGKRGLEVVPCLTNDPAVRIGAVDHFLRSTVAGGKPAITLCRKTPTMRAGMGGRYCLKLIENQAKKTYAAVPDKNNPYSHLQDALQYVCHAIRNPDLYSFSWRNHNICEYDGSPLSQKAFAKGPSLDMSGHF